MVIAFTNTTRMILRSHINNLFIYFLDAVQVSLVTVVLISMSAPHERNFDFIRCIEQKGLFPLNILI